MSTPSATKPIATGLSVYLDLVRLVAALMVLMTHVWPLMFPARPLPWPGHSAVVVFFVLSGFVISHAARPELGLRGYALHRIARIYPVLLAAALLSLVIAWTVGVNIIGYGSSRGSDLFDIGVNLLFLGQSWMDLPMPYVGTVWSLDYEVWYYVLFALWMYRPSPLLLVCTAAIAGPKILLLLPVWLLGVLLHRRMTALPPHRALWLFLASSGAGLAFIWFGVGIRLREALRPFAPGLIDYAQGSNQFLGDFVLGVIVALNFLAAGSLGLRLFVKWKGVIRYLSGFTFSLYVFHMPLAVLIWNGLHVRSPALFMGLLLAGVWVLGMLTEQRNKWYRSLLGKLWPGNTAMGYGVAAARAGTAVSGGQAALDTSDLVD
ncbi:acyltransferase [Telluria mixta]|uniref:Acyltransferase n=2 Tax=Telluria mixta TaxID=34071 RepID=A0ABT2BX71_9BURK|nr:acyltransferase [Telluria mixta]MCS0629733.1 acyltransferase [Telluria mixta]